MTLDEFKTRLLETGIFRKVGGDGQYRCDACPYCGDTKKHLYVMIRFGDDTPVLYHCFKCTKSGVVNEKFLEFYGIDNLKIPKMKGRKMIQSSGSNNSIIDLISEEKDQPMIQLASDYILKRLNVHTQKTDLQQFQLIGNPQEYVDKYLGGNGYGLKNRIWFRLCNGNIIGRSLNDSGERWKKYNSVYKTHENGLQYGTYMIRKFINISGITHVRIAEGVMDCIGLYYLDMMGGDVDSKSYIGCMGRDYTLGIKQAIDMGLFGDSVVIDIMKDTDVDIVRIPDKYRLLFKSINVYQNALAKDYGVPISQIHPERIL